MSDVSLSSVTWSSMQTHGRYGLQHCKWPSMCTGDVSVHVISDSLQMHVVLSNLDVLGCAAFQQHFFTFSCINTVFGMAVYVTLLVAFKLQLTPVQHPNAEQATCHSVLSCPYERGCTYCKCFL